MASTRLGRGRHAAPALFLAPFLLLFTATLLAPIGYAVWMSLYREQAASGLGFGGTETLFVGIDNYLRALGDAGFRRGFVHIALYCLLYIPVMVGGALVLALLVDSALARAKRFFQLAYFLPHAVPGLIAAIVWGFLYTPGLSPCSTSCPSSARTGTCSAPTRSCSPWPTPPPGSGSATTW